ncbi:MAG TPA: FAD-binding oxidoreductase, partial [Nitrososphaerales archaeon]|nr:FAD-binding oxidoreductase [Nitrososphaerales archaeon]
MRKVTGGPELVELSRDAGTEVIEPRVAYFASSEEEVAACLKEAEEHGLAITARGGGTGIPTQSVGGGALVLHTDASTTVTGDLVRCRPGVVKAELNRRLAQNDRWVPVDPSSYASCTVGGMVANNSSGARSLKYGATIRYVRELRVVLPGGGRAVPVRALPLEEAMSGDPRTRRVASLLAENQKQIAEDAPRVTKNSSGYRLEGALQGDVLALPRLFVGSEGTLGFTTEATLATSKRPAWRLLFIVETSLAELGQVAAEFRALMPSALELVDKSVFSRVGRWEKVAGYSRSDDEYMVFCEFDGDGSLEGTAERVASSPVAGLDPVAVTDPSDVQAAWEVRNETLALAQEIRDGPRRLVPGVED